MNAWTQIAQLIYETESLRRLVRMHTQTLGNFDPTDNIGAHSHLTFAIAFLLAERAGADPHKTATMAGFHDLEEARTGDRNWIHKRYTKIDERKVDQEQLACSPLLQKLIAEFRAGRTLEAHLAKDADYLAEIVLLKIYENSGNQEAWDWLRPEDFTHQCQSFLRLKTDEARQLALEIVKQNPHDWWDNIWTSE